MFEADFWLPESVNALAAGSDDLFMFILWVTVVSLVLVFLLLLWRCTTLRLVAQDHVTLDFGARAEGLSRSSARPNLAVAEADLAVAALQASRPVAPRGQNE